MSKFVEIITGEFVFDFMPNGGKAVLIRTTIVTLLLYSLAIFAKSYARENAIFEFSLIQLRIEFGETIPWLGAIFGGTYAAFYSRFSSQWTYLADLYNQQMSVASTIKDEDFNNENFQKWQAAFIEDAVHMHLATKIGFSNVIYELLDEDGIKEVLLKQEHFGEKKYNELKARLNKCFNSNKSSHSAN